MTSSSTCHPSSRSGPCVSNLDPNSACLHASLIRRWPENMRGGAVTFTCALYSVSAEKHMSGPWCRLAQCGAHLRSCTSVKSHHDRLVPRELLFSWCLFHFILKSKWKWAMCNTSRLSFKPKWCHKNPISEVKSVEGGVKRSSPNGLFDLWFVNKLSLWVSMSALCHVDFYICLSCYCSWLKWVYFSLFPLALW